MTILQGTMPDGTVDPNQADSQGRLVAEGLPGPQGPAGPPGVGELPPNPQNGDVLAWDNGLIWVSGIIPAGPVETSPITQVFAGSGPSATMHGLRFDGARETAFDRTPSLGVPTTWSFSVWVKPGVSQQSQGILGAVNPATQERFSLTSANKVIWVWSQGGNSKVSSTVLPYNAWTHIVFVSDTTNANEADRLRLYINGARDSFSGSTVPVDTAWEVNQSKPTTLGYFWDGDFSKAWYNGYMSDVYFVDGQALEPTAFGADYGGSWGPLDSSIVKTNIGAFGANGFFLPFDPAATAAGFNSIGVDASGNDNHFHDSNFVLAGNTQDTVLDTPMNNYAVLATGTNGNLVASVDGTSITYLGEAGTNYYYEANGIGAVHTGGSAFSSISGRTYNFGQQPFAQTPTATGRLFKSTSREIILELTDNTGFYVLAIGDKIKEKGNGDDASGTVKALDGAALPPTITVVASTGTWDVGSQVVGPIQALYRAYQRPHR